ncbi:Smr/MutS family protein [Quisquiliibacterium transsilvanicum]|uniref:DNA-nicking Smr family endonuclease n=1 Tax=Quisquiliibacterium transsilvanicum TaxID=1549638 RepID=A0A7W8HEK1_9BURK|nr:Smr/MutS family protein [Quisquiliibacterium transsilvanicum]MBB5270649.1 DNA-nicking Smr family endonuclease [Quisquiliibacterium transsilvanicum]
MIRPVKSFDALGGLREALRARDRAREAERERLRLERARAEREAGLFRASIGEAVPLKPTGRVDPSLPSPPPHPRQRELDERAALAASLSDEIGIEQLLDTDEELSFRRENVGPDVLPRLRRGHWVVQNQLDLHGLRVDEAREALVAFIARALKREQRCLRVIHGKGLGSAGKEPVLKGKVLKWLVQRDEVLAFCQARPTDGGAGALIVLLRPAARSATARPPRR